MKEIVIEGYVVRHISDKVYDEMQKMTPSERREYACSNLSTEFDDVTCVEGFPNNDGTKEE